MIKLKFKNKDKELEFFKSLNWLNYVEEVGIRYAEMINDMDVVEREKEYNLDGPPDPDQYIE